MPWGKCPTSGVIPLQAYPASKFSEKDELVTGVIVQRLLWTPHAAFTEFWPEGRDQPVILKVPTVLSSYLRWNETIFLKKVQCVWGCSFALVTPEKSMHALPSTREWNWWRVPTPCDDGQPHCLCEPTSKTDDKSEGWLWQLCCEWSMLLLQMVVKAMLPWSYRKFEASKRASDVRRPRGRGVRKRSRIARNLDRRDLMMSWLGQLGSFMMVILHALSKVSSRSFCMLLFASLWMPGNTVRFAHNEPPGIQTCSDDDIMNGRQNMTLMWGGFLCLMVLGVCVLSGWHCTGKRQIYTTGLINATQYKNLPMDKDFVPCVDNPDDLTGCLLERSAREVPCNSRAVSCQTLSSLHVQVGVSQTPGLVVHAPIAQEGMRFRHSFDAACETNGCVTPNPDMLGNQMHTSLYQDPDSQDEQGIFVSPYTGHCPSWSDQDDQLECVDSIRLHFHALSSDAFVPVYTHLSMLVDELTFHFIHFIRVRSEASWLVEVSG